MGLALPPERGAKHPSQVIHDHACTMRPKNVSDKLKRHRQTFHLARRDPERWEWERSVTLSENLREAQERASIAEREVERTKGLLEQSQRQVSPVMVCEGELCAHEIESFTPCRRIWQHLKRHERICNGSIR